MCDANRGVGGVYRLTSWAGGAKYVNANLVLANFNLFWLINLRKNQYSGSRGVDAALSFGDRHALNAVNATFILHVGPNPIGWVGGIGLDCNLNVLDATEVRLSAVEDFGFPTL